MKHTTTNLTIIGNEEMGKVTISQNGKTPMFMDYEHLEEMRDLLIDFVEIELYGSGALMDK